MGLLDTVRERLSEQQCLKRQVAIGADLIPRADPGDVRYSGVDLAARSRDLDVLRVGMARLNVTPDDLPSDLRVVAERIANELRSAGPEEIGRFATDALYAYSEVPNLSPMVETAMFLAWMLAIQPQMHAGS